MDPRPNQSMMPPIVNYAMYALILYVVYIIVTEHRETGRFPTPRVIIDRVVDGIRRPFVMASASAAAAAAGAAAGGAASGPAPGPM